MFTREHAAPSRRSLDATQERVRQCACVRGIVTVLLVLCSIKCDNGTVNRNGTGNSTDEPKERFIQRDCAWRTLARLRHRTHTQKMTTARANSARAR